MQELAYTLFCTYCSMHTSPSMRLRVRQALEVWPSSHACACPALPCWGPTTDLSMPHAASSMSVGSMRRASLVAGSLHRTQANHGSCTHTIDGFLCLRAAELEEAAWHAAVPAFKAHC